MPEDAFVRLDLDRTEAALLQRVLSTDGTEHPSLRLGLTGEVFLDADDRTTASRARRRLFEVLTVSADPSGPGTARLPLDAREASVAERALARLEALLEDGIEQLEDTGGLMRRAIAAGRAQRLRSRIQTGAAGQSS